MKRLLGALSGLEATYRAPYERLVEENARRGLGDPELELADTGVFDRNRYADVTASYAKAGPDDVLIRIEVANRSAGTARIHLLPTLWFRNHWSWGYGPKPSLERLPDGSLAAAPQDGWRRPRFHEARADRRHGLRRPGPGADPSTAQASRPLPRRHGTRSPDIRARPY